MHSALSALSTTNEEPDTLSESLTTVDLQLLIQQVFQPTTGDTGLLFMVDLPDKRMADNDDWRERRMLAAEWCRVIQRERETLGLSRISLAWYRNAGGNNADLPKTCHLDDGKTVFHNTSEIVDRPDICFAELFGEHSMVMALTELSATAPLKVAARNGDFRAATMGGFLPSMIPAMKLDYGEINRRVNMLRELLDQAESAHCRFTAFDSPHNLTIDLRHRTGHASGGLFPTNGVAGNLPSGEAYIVPYEGEIAGVRSRTAGTLPLQIDNELVIYKIAGNRVVDVLTDGPESDRQRVLVAAEPAYANVAELGLGVLGDFGLQPTGSILLDEKLGLHIAFGRSDQFGGTVGPDDFSSPAAVVHLDRVFIRATMPGVNVDSVILEGPNLNQTIIVDGAFIGFGR